MSSHWQGMDSFTSSLVQKLDGELICGICLEFFKTPLLLPCGHNFCQECVLGIIENCNSFSIISLAPPTSFNCPVCQAVVPLSQGYGGFSNIDNLLVNRALESIVTLYRECAPVDIFDAPWLRGMDIIPAECQEHHLKEDMFCDSCNEVTCQECVKKKHSVGKAKHRVVSLTQCVLTYQAEISDILTDLKKKMLPVTERIHQLEQLMTHIQANEEIIKGKLTENVASIQATVRAQQDELKRQLVNKTSELQRPLQERLARHQQIKVNVTELMRKLSTIRKTKEPGLKLQLMKDTSAQLNNLLCSDISDCLQEPEIPQVDMLAWTLDIQPLVESISGWAWTRRDGDSYGAKKISISTQTVEDLVRTDTLVPESQVADKPQLPAADSGPDQKQGAGVSRLARSTETGGNDVTADLVEKEKGKQESMFNSHQLEIKEKQESMVDPHQPEIEEKQKSVVTSHQPEIEEKQKSVVSSHQPEMEGKQKSVVSSHQPEMEGKQKSEVNSHQLEIEEKQKSVVSSHQPEIEEKQKSVVSSHQPEMEGKQKSEVNSHQPEIEEKQKSVVSSHQPEIEEKQESMVNFHQLEIEEKQDPRVDSHQLEIEKLAVRAKSDTSTDVIGRSPKKNQETANGHKHFSTEDGKTDMEKFRVELLQNSTDSRQDIFERHSFPTDIMFGKGLSKSSRVKRQRLFSSLRSHTRTPSKSTNAGALAEFVARRRTGSPVLSESTVSPPMEANKDERVKRRSQPISLDHFEDFDGSVSWPRSVSDGAVRGRLYSDIIIPQRKVSSFNVTRSLTRPKQRSSDENLETGKDVGSHSGKVFSKQPLTLSLDFDFGPSKSASDPCNIDKV